MSLIVALVASACWLPPVDAPVVDPFRPPTCVWCPGNRGVEFGTGPGVDVRAVASGTVTYAGVVAGTGYLVVRHADGRRVTYGGVVQVRARAGDPVVARSRIGVTDRDLHVGLRDGDRYLDPAVHFGRLVHRPRLVPTDGTAARPGPPPRLRCSSRGPG